MKRIPFLLSALGFAACAVAADALTVIAPVSNSVVSLHTPAQELFLRLSDSERRALISDMDRSRAALHRIGWWPDPVKVRWSDARADSYSLEVLDGEKLVFSTNGLGSCGFDVWNLEIARTYRIRVRACCGESTNVAATVFVTGDKAPRIMRLASIPNIRDLGGRIGLNGRRVRQGRVYRSAGLNENANDYYRGPEAYRLWQEGRLGESAEGREYLTWINEHKSMTEEDFKSMGRTMLVKHWRTGAERLTAEDRAYMKDVLGIRTDIDLRTDRECYGMTGSPLGSDVRWIHVPAQQYGGITNAAGRGAFAKVFRAFLDERNYPIDFHCIAGADRTGSLAYVLNALLGVSEDELQKDWEVTCWWSPTLTGHEKRFDRLRRAIDGYPGETVRERAERYVLAAGFTPDDIVRFREIMLEKPGERPLTVLMIGNSFSESVMAQAPAIARSMGLELRLCSAYIGGCPLQRHVENVAETEAGFTNRQYIVDSNFGQKGRADLIMLLRQELWDIVTIQQASPESPFADTYEPYAGKLIGAIRKYAPQAEIRVQQTWSYAKTAKTVWSAADGRGIWVHAGITNRWTQADMFQSIAGCCENLAKRHGFAVIPTGSAVETYRRLRNCAFIPPTEVELASYGSDAEIPKTDDAVGAIRFGKNGKLRVDFKHLNERGEYLQGLVWVGHLFGVDPQKCLYCPACVDETDADLMRRAAHEALGESQTASGGVGK